MKHIELMGDENHGWASALEEIPKEQTTNWSGIRKEFWNGLIYYSENGIKYKTKPKLEKYRSCPFWKLVLWNVGLSKNFPIEIEVIENGGFKNQEIAKIILKWIENDDDFWEQSCDIGSLKNNLRSAEGFFEIWHEVRKVRQC
jgi:hypothetical protein